MGFKLKWPKLPKADSWNPFSPSGTPFANLTELEDPFGVDPIGRALHEAVAKGLDPSHSGPELNEQIQAQQKAQGTDIGPPNKADANKAGLDFSKEEGRRRRAAASRTLFTGGQGVLDQPTTASNILLGV